MTMLLSICVGIGLSAACGLRVFVPMLLMGLAAKAGFLHPAHGFEWVGSWPAIAAFGTALVLELAGSSIPWVDHAVDVIAAPAAVLAGTLAMAAHVDGAGPLVSWATGLATGGVLAGATHLASAGTRLVTTATTGGAANPLLSGVQGAAATVLSFISIALPVVGAAIVVVGVALIVRWRLHRARPATATAQAAT